jgi:DNA polymerase-3 subunit beta
MGAMKITCDREQLLHAFQTVASVVPARSPKPVLQNVKLQVDEEGAALSATDLEIGIRHQVTGVEVQAPGAVLLPVSRFGAILREGGDEKLHLEADGQGTTVRGERSQYQLSSANPAEYPNVADFKEEACFETGARLFRELIRRTVYATENESSRYALGGVKLEFEAQEITAIGTDGRRLAKMVGPLGRHGEIPESGQNTIVPTKAMQLIERTIATVDTEVQLAVRGSELLVRSEHATISARLLEGRYPDWKKVFPSQRSSQQIELPVGPMLAAVRQAAIVTSEESRGVDFTFGDGMLILSAHAAEVGQSRVELPIGYDADPITITLDPRFVIDFLKVLDAEKTMTIDVQDSDAAAVCSTDDGYGYVIMPLARDR